MAMSSNETIYLKNYTPSNYTIDETHLRFELEQEKQGQLVTVVIARLKCRRQTHDNKELRLDGQFLHFRQLKIDEVDAEPSNYTLDDEGITIRNLPDTCWIETVVWIKPEENTALEGLYKSHSAFCTQCEAEGFRRITYYLDRPDVMSVFTTTIVANKSKYPVLLSNGNPVDSGDQEGGLHYVTWHDPFPKPCYLFAMVAGDLVKISDTFTTQSGKPIDLRIYVEKHNRDKCQHAMESLKKAMRWDEETYGLEYDLDIYMIVAVEDFNMGAMENKGLNVFNAKYVLANAESATDKDYENIEGVIAHEYFHNWTGNRVTCRDWFQLSLKEGLTVFRDQNFTADMQSAAVKRIDDVRLLRTWQFIEDASPMAHPIRPASYIEINNFYTATVYNKGAEVIRMIHTILGKDNFRKGMDLYFQRHDGQAVTTEDFVAAMADASGFDLSQFQSWYNQAGTPVLDIQTDYDSQSEQFNLHISQSCRPTPETSGEKKPFIIPVSMGIFNREGKEVHQETLLVTDKQQNYSFTVKGGKPVVSLLRNFSAPVNINPWQSTDELAFLMRHDTDPFNRWEAGQQLITRYVLNELNDENSSSQEGLLDAFVDGCREILLDETLDPALKALALTLPSESYLLEKLPVADVDGIYRIRNKVRNTLKSQLQTVLLNTYRSLKSEKSYHFSAQESGRRSLRNTMLAWLMVVRDEAAAMLGEQHYHTADNMTDEMAALSQLVHIKSALSDRCMQDFEQKWNKDALVMDKWFSLNAMAERPDVLNRVKQLLDHPSFDIKNPNKVRSLLGVYAMSNLPSFHAKTGEGYAFIMDMLLFLDKTNPQITARMAKVFSRWRHFDETRKELMREQLERASKEKLSRDLYEVISKSLEINQ